MTTFERLAKILKGETPPANSVETAFSGLSGSMNNALPAVTASDKGKVLIVNNDGKWSVGEIPTPEETQSAEAKASTRKTKAKEAEK